MKTYKDPNDEMLDKIEQEMTDYYNMGESIKKFKVICDKMDGIMEMLDKINKIIGDKGDGKS